MFQKYSQKTISTKQTATILLNIKEIITSNPYFENEAEV